MSVRTEKLLEIIKRIEGHEVDKDARFGAYDWKWGSERQLAYRKYTRDFVSGLLEEYGGSASDMTAPLRLRIAGVTTTCTSSLEGALRNWITAAKRKLAARNAAT